MKYCFLTIGSWENTNRYMRFRELGREMQPFGVEVHYIVDDLPSNTDAVLALPPGSKVHRLPPLSSLAAVRARRRLLKALKPDWVHVLNTPVRCLPVLMGLGMKIVSDWDEWFQSTQKGFGPQQVLVRLADRWYRRNSELLVVCSRHMQNEFKKIGYDSAYIPYATYLNLPEHTDNPFDQPTAVYMGSLYASFDADVLFEALAILKARGVMPPVRFVGGGPELEKWEQFIKDKDLSNVKMMGYLSDKEMFDHVKHAHLLLFPIRTNHTNLCRCPSKAYTFAQAGRPVITNHVGEVPEVLGTVATYIDCTPEAFADAIEKAMPQPQPAVEYDLEKLRWAGRARDLLAALERK